MNENRGSEAGGAAPTAPPQGSPLERLMREPLPPQTQSPDQVRALPQVGPPQPAPTADAGYDTDDLMRQLQPSAPRRSRRGWRSWFGLPPSKAEQSQVAGSSELGEVSLELKP